MRCARSARAPRARDCVGRFKANGFSGPPAADQTGGNAGVHCVASSGMGQFTSPHRHLPHHQGSGMRGRTAVLWDGAGDGGRTGTAQGQRAMTNRRHYQGTAIGGSHGISGELVVPAVEPHSARVLRRTVAVTATAARRALHVVQKDPNKKHAASRALMRLRGWLERG